MQHNCDIVRIPLQRHIIRSLNFNFGETFNVKIGENIDIYDGLKICISFSLGENRSINLFSINKCSISGTELLKIFEEVMTGKKIRHIYLDDQSSVSVGRYDVDLSTICILRNSDSWYNSRGYYQSSYEVESKKWNLLRNAKLEVCLEICSQVDYFTYKSKNKGWFHDGLQIYVETMGNAQLTIQNYNQFLEMMLLYLSECFDVNETMTTIFSRQHQLIKDADEEYHFNYLLLVSMFSYCIDYTRCPLCKVLS